MEKLRSCFGVAALKITIIAVGKLKEKYLRDGVNEYYKRLSRFCEIEMVEVNEEEAPEGLSSAQEAQLKKKEAERIIKKIKDGSIVIALDIKGCRVDSEAFAKKLEEYMISGKSHITFIIGGSLGLDDELVKRADFRLSLSDMTFPHQLARLILLEQLFRCFKIINGEPYHK